MNRRCSFAAGTICIALSILPARAQRAAYSFTRLATLGDPAAGGGNHIVYFQPGAVNNHGDIIYDNGFGPSADPASLIGEGVYLRKAGQREIVLAHTGAAAPGGGTFDNLELGALSVNDMGNAAFAFTLSPFGTPTGRNSALYRYNDGTRRVTPVVFPDNTPAPGGGKFKGVAFNAIMNNRDEIVFTGLIATDKGVHVAGQGYSGLGAGVFKADARDRITSVVSPGDRAPGGGFFDYAGTSGAGGAWINQGGDIAFIAHVAGQESVFEGFPPQTDLISALGSLYVRDARTGNITSLVTPATAPPAAVYSARSFHL